MNRPNVLLVHSDQQRWDALGANGNEDIHTPNLDELAAEGVNLERYFVQNPVCAPSRMSYLTGQYPSQLRIYRNGIPLPEDARTLPRLLDGAGYTTGSFGKLHFLPHANRDHRRPHPDYGFDELAVSDNYGSYRDAYRKWVERVAPEELDDVSLRRPPAAERWDDSVGNEDDVSHLRERYPMDPDDVEYPASPEVTHAAFVADRTIDFLGSHRDDRFCCVAGFYNPHPPWMAPRKYLDRYDPDDLEIPSFPPDLEAERDGVDISRAGFEWSDSLSDESLRRARQVYYAQVSELDHHVGRILDALDERGLREDTLVVFTSDHGEFLGEHLRYGKGWPGSDAVSRVPCLVRWPGAIDDSDGPVDELIEAVDLVPTLLDAAGVQAPPTLQGRSFLPIVADDGREYEPRDSALFEGPDGRSLRTDRYRYTLFRDGTERLFDLREDPECYHDRSDDSEYREPLADLRRRLGSRIIDVQSEAQRPRTWTY